MIEDIYWVIERQHSDGGWEAVASRMRCNLLDLADDHPLVEIGKRRADVFATLSGLRRYNLADQTSLAKKGLPSDISAYAAHVITRNMGVGALQAPGFLSLGSIRTTAAERTGCIIPDETSRRSFAAWAAHLEAALRDPAPASVAEILVSPSIDDSNHARMARTARAKELRPIGDSTLRLIIAYDL